MSLAGHLVLIHTLFPASISSVPRMANTAIQAATLSTFTGQNAFIVRSSYLVQLLNRDRDLIARPADVVQAHRNGRSGRNAARYPHVDLVQSCESRSIAKPQHFCHPTAD